MSKITTLDPTRISPRTRSHEPLTESTEKRLLAYLATAGAGLAMMAPAAGATSLTPVSEHIGWNTDTFFDINQDAIDDIVFTHSQSSWYFSSNSFGTGANLRVRGVGKGLIASSWSSGEALNLSPSNIIDSKLSFGGSYGGKKGVGLARVSSGSSYWGTQPTSFSYKGGPFTDKKNSFVSGFLGVYIAPPDGPRYGFVRLEVTTLFGNYIDAYITGYGFEPGIKDPAHIPATKGQIPEPSSLSLLGLGIAGLALWRRRKAKNDAPPQA